MNDKNNNDCNINGENISAGKIYPIRRLFEKSGNGNIKKPPNKPTKIDMYAVFSFIFLL